MRILTGYSNELSPGIQTKLFKYRYDVFVNRLGWELDTPMDMEKDQFDHEDTLYVVAKDDEQNIQGCARLLPTTEPYLLEEVFPELLNGMPAPKSNEIWEVSRFTNASTTDKQTSGISVGNGGQISEVSFYELLKKTIQCAKMKGAKHLISVSPVGIERLLKKCKISSHRLGPPIISNNHAIVACWINIEESMI